VTAPASPALRVRRSGGATSHADRHGHPVPRVPPAGAARDAVAPAPPAAGTDPWILRSQWWSRPTTAAAAGPDPAQRAVATPRRPGRPPRPPGPPPHSPRESAPPATAGSPKPAGAGWRTRTTTTCGHPRSWRGSCRPHATPAAPGSTPAPSASTALADRERNPPPSPERVAELLPRYNAVPEGGSNVVGQRDVLASVGPFDTRLYNTEDWEMWIRLAQGRPTGRGS
jgi:hypothetical protein